MNLTLPTVVFLIYFLIVTSDSYKNDFHRSLFDNINDALHIIGNWRNATSFIQAFQENRLIGVEQYLLGLVRKDLDEASTCGQFIKSRGFEYEIFYVTTSDGYILAVYRIRNPMFDKNAVKPRPFLLVPAGLASCSLWFENKSGQQGSLAYFLVNQGEDVWIVNYRGTTYSRNHTHLDPWLDPEFYEYSYDDIGMKDIPPTVELMKKVTGHEKIRLVTFSLSTTFVLVQLSLDPSYTDNYELVFLVGPLGYLGGAQGFFQAFPRDPLSLGILGRLRLPFPPFIPFFDAGTTETFCTFTIMEPICRQVYFGLFGPDSPQTNVSRLAVYASQIEPLSAKMAAHILQGGNTDHLAFYSYKKSKNLKLYRSINPPFYPYHRIPTHNMVIFSGLGDYLATPGDVQKLVNSFEKRPLVHHIIKHPTWSHLDFIFAKEVGRYFHHVLYNITQRYTNDPTGANLHGFNNGELPQI